MEETPDSAEAEKWGLGRSLNVRQLLSDLRSRGVEFQLSGNGQRVLFRGASDDDRALIRRERPWLLMLLAHEVGGDFYDPRLAFLADAELGLTRGAVATRMEIAFGISHELANALIQLAESAGFLRRRGGLVRPVGALAWKLGSVEEKTFERNG